MLSSCYLDVTRARNFDRDAEPRLPFGSALVETSMSAPNSTPLSHVVTSRPVARDDVSTPRDLLS